MNIFVYIFLGVATAWLIYSVAVFWNNIRLAKELVEVAVPYSRISDDDKIAKALLVLGDSTAVGVGSEPEQTLAFRLADHVQATHVENYAVSGARAKDIEAQMQSIQRESYTAILIQVGANDIIRMSDLGETAETIAESVRSLRKYSDAVYVLSAGDVGASTFFPFPLPLIYHYRTMKHHALMEHAITEAGGVYVNLYTPKKDDVFVTAPEIYFAKDGLHPSGAGYGVWFERLSSTIR